MPKVITKKAIREFRKSLKLTQAKFAKHMGVSVWTIHTWEQAKKKVEPPKRLISDPRTAHLAEEVPD